MKHPQSGPMILAVRRDEPAATDQKIKGAADRARSAGMRLAGVLQQNSMRAGKKKCDMELVDIASGAIVRISEDRGGMARGCRMDWNAVTRAAASVEDTIRRDCVDLLIINKFGKAEEDGRGMRDAIAAAIEFGVPVLLSIGPLSLPSFIEFAGDFCRIAEADDPVIDAWLTACFQHAAKTGRADVAVSGSGFKPVNPASPSRSTIVFQR